MSISFEKKGQDENGPARPGKPSSETHPLRRTWASSFRRTQLMLGLWGLLVIAGGMLHNSFGASPPKGWGTSGLLLVWLGLTVLGLLGMQFLTPESLNSGQLLVWGVVLIVAAGLTLFLIYGLNSRGYPIAIIWHLAFATGYLAAGYWMDRRLWLLAGWEIAVAIVMLLFGLGVLADGSQATSLPKSPPDDDDDNYIYRFLAFDPRTVVMQVLGFTPRNDQGLVFGLSSGIPLLLAALPFWKERYGKS